MVCKGSLRGDAPDIDDMLADIDTEQETREEAQNKQKKHGNKMKLNKESK